MRARLLSNYFAALPKLTRLSS